MGFCNEQECIIKQLCSIKLASVCGNVVLVIIIIIFLSGFCEGVCGLSTIWVSVKTVMNNNVLPSNFVHE